MYQCGVQSYCGARIAVEHILCTIAASVNRHSTASIGCRPIEVEYGMYGLSRVAGVFVCTEKSRAVVRDIMLIRIILSLPTDHFRLYTHTSSQPGYTTASTLAISRCMHIFNGKAAYLHRQPYQRADNMEIAQVQGHNGASSNLIYTWARTISFVGSCSRIGVQGMPSSS
uniref:Uncharacterized protein n=1 Tax=Spironucleus salmonicida TaxID=348837 RepID=V6LRE9_9EUKA|eukprot:EST46833.1 Hypothetical protein SS50377_13131 [Spironucleus salmonicida]